MEPAFPPAPAPSASLDLLHTQPAAAQNFVATGNRIEGGGDRGEGKEAGEGGRAAWAEEERAVMALLTREVMKSPYAIKLRQHGLPCSAEGPGGSGAVGAVAGVEQGAGVEGGGDVIRLLTKDVMQRLNVGQHLVSGNGSLVTPAPAGSGSQMAPGRSRSLLLSYPI